MNGSRTNQFVAPTSFITSTSRRRAKIDRRIVFAIRSTAEIASTSTSPPITASMIVALRNSLSVRLLP